MGWSHNLFWWVCLQKGNFGQRHTCGNNATWKSGFRCLSPGKCHSQQESLGLSFAWWLQHLDSDSGLQRRRRRNFSSFKPLGLCHFVQLENSHTWSVLLLLQGCSSQRRLRWHPCLAWGGGLQASISQLREGCCCSVCRWPQPRSWSPEGRWWWTQPCNIAQCGSCCRELSHIPSLQTQMVTDSKHRENLHTSPNW